MFIDQCLWKVLGVRRDNNSFLLIEDHCDPPYHWTDCDDPLRVSFHPFKELQAYTDCMDNANRRCQPPTSTTTLTTTSTTRTATTSVTTTTQVILILPTMVSTTALPATSSASGCAASCAYSTNPLGTCASHIQAMADHISTTNPDSCKHAYVLTVQMCPVCQSCPLDVSGCVVTAATDPMAPTVATPSAEDCKVGYSNWEWEWSDTKMAWCCSHTGRGCNKTGVKEPFDCDADLTDWEGAWSDKKKTWCCGQFGRGCQVFDCNEDFIDWQRGWSEDKRTWCCKHEQRGCSTPVMPEV